MTRFLISELEGTTQNSRTTAAELDAQLISLLKDLEVELIILDEIQNIASSYDGIEFQRIIKYFCYLIDSNKIRCSIIFAGTSSAKRLITFGRTAGKFDDDEQMSRRQMRPIEIKPILPKTKNWIACCNWFIQQVGLPNLTKDEHSELLDRIYLAYSEHTMSTMRDLFLRNNTRNAKNYDQLIEALFENFEKYAIGAVNPFDYELLTKKQLDAYLNEQDKNLRSQFYSGLC
ncbi:TniB family NTP-binding protein [Pseudoalteromonas sp. 2CM36K]|nr:TniB family NTP-binding protein [Pseudoalteromonas sp. 2CM36K]